MKNKPFNISQLITIIMNFEILDYYTVLYIFDMLDIKSKISLSKVFPKYKLLETVKTLKYETSEKLMDDDLKELKSLTYLDCGYGGKFTDESMKELKYLTYLDCGYGGNFTDESLKELKYLTHLNCSQSIFTDASLKELKQLKTLYYCPGRSNFSESCLKELGMSIQIHELPMIIYGGVSLVRRMYIGNDMKIYGSLIVK